MPNSIEFKNKYEEMIHNMREKSKSDKKRIRTQEKNELFFKIPKGTHILVSFRGEIEHDTFVKLEKSCHQIFIAVPVENKEDAIGFVLETTFNVGYIELIKPIYSFQRYLTESELEQIKTKII